MTSPRRPSRATTAQHDVSRRRSRVVAALLLGGALTLAGCAGADEPGSTGSGSATTPPATQTASSAPSGTTSASTTAALTTIITPANGSTVPAGVITVTGTGTAFEGTLTWQVLAADTGNVITHDFTTAGANGTVGPFTFTVDLTPGSYTLEVWEPGAADTATAPANRHALATSTFTVA
jgi:hypothetical protein